MDIDAILLDLGNVVLGVDFRRVFDCWSELSQVPSERFYSRWSIDAAYKEHEKGLIDFETYSDHLSQKFQISLTQDQWSKGWNELWTQPIKSTVDLLPELASKFELYALSNTNLIHADFFKKEYQPELSDFHKIYISNEIGLRKPDVECFEYICEETRVSPEKVFFLDDTLEHIAGAKSFGINAEQVTSELGADQILKRTLGL